MTRIDSSDPVRQLLRRYGAVRTQSDMKRQSKRRIRVLKVFGFVDFGKLPSRESP